MGTDPRQTSEEIEAIMSLLRDARPEPTGAELERARERAIAQASAGSWAPRKGLMMKPRIAVAFVLALGLMTSGAGATLAVISDSGSSSKVQYPDLERGGGDLGEVLGETRSGGSEESGRPGGEGGPGGGEGGPGGGEGGPSGGGTAPEAAVQEESQLASGGGDELPFTGFLAIPLLIVGVGLLVAGGVMRTRTRSTSP